MPWKLDTNAWIDLFKHPDGAVHRWLQKHSQPDFVTCAIVWAELLHGALKYGVPTRGLALVRHALQPFRSLPFDDRAVDHYAHVRHALEQTGQSIGPNDLIIAAICLTHGCTLVTANVGEFQRVPGLRVEDWRTVRTD